MLVQPAVAGSADVAVVNPAANTEARHLYVMIGTAFGSVIASCMGTFVGNPADGDLGRYATCIARAELAREIAERQLCLRWDNDKRTCGAP
jgi:hypothetical protein